MCQILKTDSIDRMNNSKVLNLINSFFTHDSKGSIVEFWFLKFLYFPLYFISHFNIYQKVVCSSTRNKKLFIFLCVIKVEHVPEPPFISLSATWHELVGEHVDENHTRSCKTLATSGDDKWESENIIFSFFILSWNNTTFDYAENLSVRGINNSNWDVWH